jgi:hypothetical protein
MVKQINKYIIIYDRFIFCNFGDASLLACFFYVLFFFVGIRVVKLYAWEQSFTDKVDRVRQLEVKKLKVKQKNKNKK